MSVYSIAGATLSEKNVSEEYQLSSAQLDKGVESGALKVQWRSFHGNLYRLLVKEKQDLEQWLMANDPKAATQAAKDAAKVAKETTKKATKQAAKATKSGSQKRKLDDENS